MCMRAPIEMQDQNHALIPSGLALSQSRMTTQTASSRQKCNRQARSRLRDDSDGSFEPSHTCPIPKAVFLYGVTLTVM